MSRPSRFSHADWLAFAEEVRARGVALAEQVDRRGALLLTHTTAATIRKLAPDAPVAGSPPAATSYEIPDGPKMLRETLCVAQALIANSDRDQTRKHEHINRLQRLIDACDRHRPLGPDGKHGDRHTATCGCEDREVRA